jgi:hypothetical protein
MRVNYHIVCAFRSKQPARRFRHSEMRRPQPYISLTARSKGESVRSQIIPGESSGWQWVVKNTRARAEMLGRAFSLTVKLDCDSRKRAQKEICLTAIFAIVRSVLSGSRRCQLLTTFRRRSTTEIRKEPCFLVRLLRGKSRGIQQQTILTAYGLSRQSWTEPSAFSRSFFPGRAGGPDLVVSGLRRRKGRRMNMEGPQKIAKFTRFSTQVAVLIPVRSTQ